MSTGAVGYLRDAMGYKGVILTDDMEMGVRHSCLHAWVASKPPAATLRWRALVATRLFSALLLFCCLGLMPRLVEFTCYLERSSYFDALVCSISDPRKR